MTVNAAAAIALSSSLACRSKNIAFALARRCLATSVKPAVAQDRLTKTLLRTLDSEIKVQEGMMKEEKDAGGASTGSTLDVLQRHDKLTQTWRVKDEPGVSMVELSKGNLVVRFDVSEVLQGNPNTSYPDEEDEDLEEEEQEEEQEEEEEEDYDMPPMTETFPLEIQVKCPGQDRFLSLHAMAELDYGEDGGRGPRGTLSIENAAIYSGKGNENAYEGPEYHTLDVDLRNSLEEWVNGLVGAEALVPFISEYSQAKESTEYLGWLQGIKATVQANSANN